MRSLSQLKRNTEFPAFTCNEALVPCSYLKAILRANGNWKGGLTSPRQHDRFSGDTLATRENRKFPAATRETPRYSPLNAR